MDEKLNIKIDWKLLRVNIRSDINGIAANEVHDDDIERSINNVISSVKRAIRNAMKQIRSAPVSAGTVPIIRPRF